MTFMDRLNTGTLNELWVNVGPFSDEVRPPRRTGLPKIEVCESVGGSTGGGCRHPPQGCILN